MWSWNHHWWKTRRAHLQQPGVVSQLVCESACAALAWRRSLSLAKCQLSQRQLGMWQATMVKHSKVCDKEGMCECQHQLAQRKQHCDNNSALASLCWTHCGTPGFASALVDCLCERECMGQRCNSNWSGKDQQVVCDSSCRCNTLLAHCCTVATQ